MAEYVTSHREVWKPGSDLPGLRFHHEPARQPGQDRRRVRGEMDISFPQALEHIVESAKPTVNSDLR